MNPNQQTQSQTAQSKKYEQFGKQISQMLKQFEKTKQWADIGNWLIKLYPMLSSKRFGNVPHKIRLAKRLAQCLSPGLPSGIHGNALNIYQIILQNFGNKVQMLPLLSIGLFPFFQYCGTEHKYQLIQIFEKYYIKTPECLQMITSLVNALLTGFIENNQELNRKIYKLCDDIAKNYGRIWVDGAVWINILKSPKVRSAGYKYFMKSFKDRDTKEQNVRKLSTESNKSQGKKQEAKNEQNIVIKAEKPLDRSQQLKVEQGQAKSQQKNHKQQKQPTKKENKNTLAPPQENQQTRRRKVSQCRSSECDETDEDIQEQPAKQKQKQKLKNKLMKLTIQSATSLSSDMILDQASQQLRQNLLKFKQQEDSLKNRFPNLSTLVINALCQSLQSPLSDNLIRRSALDLIIMYLPLQRKDVIPEKQAIFLVTVMLRMIKLKQYSITRRVYTYLFGPPNAEGIYQINSQQRKYELSILSSAVQKLLQIVKPTAESNNIQQNYLNCLHSLSALLKDNQKLEPLILQYLAYKIIKFLRLTKLKQQDTEQFYTEIIQPNSDIFLKSIQDKMLLQQVQKSPAEARQILTTIEYFYKLKKKYEGGNTQKEYYKEVPKIIQRLLLYLLSTKCKYERLSLQTLDICTKLAALFPKNQAFNQKSQETINSLIKLKPITSIYIKLLNLSPLPDKQDLFPYINETSLQIASIKNLLLHPAESFDPKEREQLFFAIFRLFQCRIWQDQAVIFAKNYKEKYPQQFQRLIEEVQPSQWLIYWNKMNGDVDGGVIKMIKNLEMGDKTNRQQIKKWLEDSRNIASKIIDPIYKLMEKTQNKDMDHIYKMIKRVFKYQKQSFSNFFFNQRQKYLLPMLVRIFDCIENGDQQLKVASVQMLQFLLQKTQTLNQKLIFLSITLKKTLANLKIAQSAPQYSERQIQIIQYFISMADTLKKFDKNQERIIILQQIIQGEDLYQIMVNGMKMTQIPYIRTLYIQFIQRSLQILMQIGAHTPFISKCVVLVMQQIFVMIKQYDIVSLQHKIRGTDLRLSSQDMPTEEQPVSKSQFDVQAKYTQIIELWNFIRFLIQKCVQHNMHEFPILNTLNIIMQVFPFSPLKYQQVSSRFIDQVYSTIHQQINSITGLKKQVLLIFILIWENYSQSIVQFFIQKGDCKLLIHSNIDLISTVQTINKCKQTQNIISYYKNQQFKLPKQALHYNQKQLYEENKLFYFLYIFYSYCNLEKIKGKTIEFFQASLTLLQNLNTSQHTQAKIWILQILHCLSFRVDLKGFYIDHSKFKSQMHGFVRQLISDITYAASKQRIYTSKKQIKTGFFHKLNKQQIEQPDMVFDFVKPYPPTISKQEFLYQNSMKNFQTDNFKHIQDQVKYFIFSKNIDLPLQKYITYTSAICVKTFTSILIPLLFNVFQSDNAKIVSICKDNLDPLFKAYENKVKSDQIYMETFAEFIRKLTFYPTLKTEMVKIVRKNVLQIYMRNDFFKCTKNTLKYWRPVIDVCTDNYDMMEQLVSKEGLFEGLFSRKSQSQATQIQIRNFQRVCFLIYCGRIDKYDTKLRIVLQSLSKVMKSENPSPALLILILFCIRILFLRLSPSALNRLFRSIWPSLIALLIQIFSKKRFQSSINLKLAALKMIELVHALDLQQFNIHKWLFIFDYFGIKIESKTQQQIQKSEPQSLLTPFKFKPFLSRALPKQPFKCTYIPKQWPQQSNDSRVRKIIVNEMTVNTQEQLQNFAFVLLQYMVDLNQRRVTCVKQQIEDLIEEDFISLDNYIYDVK